MANRLSNIINNQWTITIVSTMVGILIGLFLTRHFEKRAQAVAQQEAMAQVFQEIEENTVLLEKHYQVMQSSYTSMDYLFSKVDDNTALVMHKDSVAQFRAATAGIFTFTGEEPLPDNMRRIRGDMNLDIESALIARDLSDIVWTSYKQTAYLSITPFKCLTGIEAMYDVQRDVDTDNASWRSALLLGQFMQNTATRASFLHRWKQLLDKQKVLMHFYSFQDDIATTCK